MASEILTLSSDNVLAEYVTLPKVAGLMSERVSIGPDLLALLIRDGRVAHAAHGAHIQVGGFWQAVRSTVGGRHALRLLIADLKPFSGSRDFVALTRDNVPVKGEATIELQVNPERPANVLGFAADHSITTKSAVIDRFMSHVNDRVLQAGVRAIDAADLRGDGPTQDRVQSAMMEEASRIYGDMGLMVRAVSLNYAFNDEEIAAIERRKLAREQDTLDAKLDNLQREIGRTAAVTTFQIKSEADIEALRAASDHELRSLIQRQEHEYFDAKESEARAQRMKALEGEIAEIKVEQSAKFELALADARSELDVKRVREEIQEVDLRMQKVSELQRSELWKLDELTKLAVARETHNFNRDRLADLDNLDQSKKDREADRTIRVDDAGHRRELESDRQRSEAEIARIQSQRDMTPDQMLAMQAGLSPDVARIFEERAKAEAMSDAERREWMERLLTVSREGGEQARHYFEQFRQGVVGVAEGAGGGTASRQEEGGTLLCGECRAPNEASRSFCGRCGAPLRA